MQPPISLCPSCRRSLDSSGRCPFCAPAPQGNIPTVMSSAQNAPTIHAGAPGSVYQAPQQPPQPVNVNVRGGGFMGGLGGGVGLGIGCCCLFPLLLVVGWMVLTAIGIGMVSQPSTQGQPLPPPPAPSPQSARPGPTFADADAVMDSRRESSRNLTDAQRADYWMRVQGTAVLWTGDLMDADLSGKGSLELRCNPENSGTDTRVELDGTQLSQLVNAQKGRRVTVRAILSEHSTAGYVLTNGRIEAF